MPFFSMIIPCHNSSKTIGRLLESLTRQGVEKEELEIILCDDASTDGWSKIAERFTDILNIRFVSAQNREMHCPGNTRRDAMKYVFGDWICFADHDDFYEDNALSDVKSFIEGTQETMCVCTILRSWNEETDEYVSFEHKQAWLHGKFYNRRNLIERFGINFRENLYTHEDIYFNSCVLASLYSIGIMDYTYYDIPTYRWVENPESITRGYKGERGYLHENFDDYIVSAAEPFWEGAVAGNEVFVNQIMMTLLHAYFYYEAVSYLYGAAQYKDNQKSIERFIRRILDELGMTSDDVVNYIYADPFKYSIVRGDCQLAEGFFIEKTSLRDFVYYLEKQTHPKRVPFLFGKGRT